MSLVGRLLPIAVHNPNVRIWTPPHLQALRFMTGRHDCLRIFGLYLRIDQSMWAIMEIRAPAPYCFIVLLAHGHSRVLPAPVRPVRHRSACSAIVSETLLFALKLIGKLIAVKHQAAI